MEHRRLFLWFIPEPRLQAVLERMIRELSSRYGGPTFSPHVTLLSGIPDEVDATDRCRRFAESCLPLELEILRVGHEADYFRALFLELRLSTALFEARRQAELGFPLHTPLLSFPHLSLAYGLISPAQARAEHEFILAQLPRTFVTGALALVSASAGLGVDSWKQLCTFPLGAARS